ncbi:nagb/rpia/CoA transferase-like protein [Multifurca ochricompacta]|uniref:Translation initiation factor eIF2B subunit beta n=1 Tax=Multifurca ochricompacta TaxID=376703 RepID=A0AAD4MC18_9AGAM|nr:nagb/rpia/CoA transferase-like protein [Multifurca ochricompacta]
MATEPQTAAGQRPVEALAAKLRRRQVVGSRETALETALVLRQVVSKARFQNINQLVEIIRSVGQKLIEAQPKEHTVGNTVRKLLHHIREEYNNASKGKATASVNEFSIANFVLQGQPRRQIAALKGESTLVLKEDDLDDPDSFARTLKPVVMEAIQDILDELETVYDNIGKSAKDHIHSDEIILTIGRSKTVETYLKSAAHYHKFTVIVAESGPSYGGHDMARSLSSSGISTFLVPDSSIYALMSRVSKVILGAMLFLQMVASTAARAHSTPVMVCAGQFKLTPLWNLYHEYGALDFADPSSVLGFEEGELVDKVDVVNPYYDYVRPDLVNVYVTNDGDHPPPSMYRLVKESYDDEDNEF